MAAFFSRLVPETGANPEWRGHLVYHDGKTRYEVEVDNPIHGDPDHVRQELLILEDRIMLAITNRGDAAGPSRSSLVLRFFDKTLLPLGQQTYSPDDLDVGFLWKDRTKAGVWISSDDGVQLVRVDGTLRSFTYPRALGLPDAEYGYIDREGSVVSAKGKQLTAPVGKPNQGADEYRYLHTVLGAWTTGAVAYTFWDDQVRIHTVSTQ